MSRAFASSSSFHVNQHGWNQDIGTWQSDIVANQRNRICTLSEKPSYWDEAEIALPTSICVHAAHQKSDSRKDRRV